jgi:hypothetical protein
MIDFLTFRRNVTPTLIAAFWYGGSLAAWLIGWAMIVQPPERGMMAGGSLGGWCLFLFGPLVLRLLCEGLILPFRVNETLTDISDTLDAIHDNSARGVR